jgi:Txe/YoeB family toxin of toxin-antitoxin system
MGKFKVVIKKAAQKDLLFHKKIGNKATVKKILVILNELQFDPRNGAGKPEQLKNNLSGLWSRRINQKDRIIYDIEDDMVTVFVLSAIGHYDDK